MHLKDKASEKLIEMPEVISNEAELLEEVIRKEIAKTQIDLEEKRLELDNLLDEEGDYSDEMEEPNSESAQEGDSSDSNFSEEFSSPNQAQPDPHPIFRPNMEGINQVAQEELHYIYGFDGFEEYLADLESEINSGNSLLIQRPLPTCQTFQKKSSSSSISSRNSSSELISIPLN